MKYYSIPKEILKWYINMREVPDLKKKRNRKNERTPVYKPLILEVFFLAQGKPEYIRTNSKY